MRERLIYALAAAGIPVDRVTITGPTSATVTYLSFATQTQIDAGDAILAAFDWSASAQATWETALQRAIGARLLSLLHPEYKLLRGVVAAILDEINVIRQQLPQLIGTAQATWDPANMANATGVTSPNVTVTGAAFGDAVDVRPPYTLQGVIAFGYVSAADTVVVRLHNGTGAAVNLGSGSWGVAVYRYGGLPDRTLTQARTAVLAKIAAGDVDS
jgi:hypothetical protein